MKTTSKASRLRTRIIAMILAVITIVSIGTCSITSASALDFNPQMSAKDACEEFGLIAGETGIETLCSLNPVTAVIGKVGLSFFNKLLDSSKPDPEKQTREEIRKSTQQIIDKINELSQTMNQYHIDETIKLDKIDNIVQKTYNNSMISAFNERYDDIKIINSDFADAIYANKKYISAADESNTMHTIDFDTYKAYKNIVERTNHKGDKGDMFSAFKYIQGYINGSLSGCGGRKCYELLADGMKLYLESDFVPGVINGGRNFEDFRNMYSVSDVRDKVNEVETDVVNYYMTCITIQKMMYDIDNYELNHSKDSDGQYTIPKATYTAYDCSDDSKYVNDIKKINSEMKDIIKYYKESQSYIDSMVGATVNVTLTQNDNVQKAKLEFTEPALAIEAVSRIKYWAVTNKDSLDVTMTLNKNWTADPIYGLAQINDLTADKEVFRDFGVYYMLNSGESSLYNNLSYNDWCKNINFTLDLNGCTVDFSRISGKNFLMSDCFTGSLTIKGDDNRKSSIVNAGMIFGQNYACNQAFGKVSIDGVTIKTGAVSSAAMFCTGVHDFSMNNCDITAGSKNIFMFCDPCTYSVTNTSFHISGAGKLTDIAKIYDTGEFGKVTCAKLENVTF